ncbi:YceD family protein [Phaeovulum vinaykumarii]|uniref:Uncharacterized metal-binding protein YceD, DUF177 family n=1 Tax=Phaeovulum vinaykumarii TaxID=407234 RepID=A0A1N7JPT4_9RHOB|nr:YceD family protein [Phaeovulum vinaykumarii]SIS51358.1 Uncharacterized metal-binding protein YceD, DUF177 family [Phaeovulum vinaykumarii]SOB90706.1 uncharacterized metal-binding protein YceD [Phaeovulum vinaykumarii]
MSDAADPLPFTHPLRPAELAARKPTRFDLAPSAEDCAAIAAWLDLDGLKGLRLKGQLSPAGRGDWELSAEMTAEVVQPCAVTLVPVRTRLAERVHRRFVERMPDLPGGEVEMPEDTDAELLGETIDLGAVMLEALELALPLFPRAPGSEIGTLQAAPPGAAPMTAETIRPFAGLDKLLGGRGTDTPEE